MTITPLCTPETAQPFYDNFLVQLFLFILFSISRMKVIHDLEGILASRRQVTNRKIHLRVWNYCQSISAVCNFFPHKKKKLSNHKA